MAYSSSESKDQMSVLKFNVLFSNYTDSLKAQFLVSNTLYQGMGEDRMWILSFSLMKSCKVFDCFTNLFSLTCK